MHYAHRQAAPDTGMVMVMANFVMGLFVTPMAMGVEMNLAIHMVVKMKMQAFVHHPPNHHRAEGD